MENRQPISIAMLSSLVGGSRRSGRELISTAVPASRHDLELVHAGGTLPVHGAEAVRAGVAATDDDDLLALRVDRRQTVVVNHRIAVLHAVGPG